MIMTTELGTALMIRSSNLCTSRILSQGLAGALLKSILAFHDPDSSKIVMLIKRLGRKRNQSQRQKAKATENSGVSE